MPEAKKATTKKANAKKSTAKKATVKKATAKVAKPVEVEEVVTAAPEVKKAEVKNNIPAGKYIYATGRRKTSVANVRLFEGRGEHLVNKKPLAEYMGHAALRAESLQAFRLTGLESQYYMVTTVKGGGPHSQAQAIRHGVAQALATLGDEVRRILKKNGFLTRDPREKERKKPGLRRARRAPQWAKR